MNVFHGITGMIFLGIFYYNYFMESMQIIDKFCASPLVIFLNMAYIFHCSRRKWRDFPFSLHFLSPLFSYALCVYLTFIAQYFNIFLKQLFYLHLGAATVQFIY